MKKDGRAKLVQAAACLLCAGIAWRYASSLAGTEFSGGWLTGSLLDMKDVGSLLFLLALLLTSFSRRIAAAIVLIACLMCLPLYLYFTAPGPFRRLFGRSEWSVPLRARFVWDYWTITGIVVLAITGYVGLRGLWGAADSQSRNSA
jgi:hypothetical protein